MNLPGTDGVEPPVVFIFGVVRGVDQPPVSVGAGDRHFHAAKSIHDAAEAIKLDHGGVVDADTEVIGDGVLQQTGTTARVAGDLSALVGGVDALHPNGGDVNPQVAGNGDERDLSFLGPDDGNDQCVGAV